MTYVIYVYLWRVVVFNILLSDFIYYLVEYVGYLE